jgi:four helix bundle protein
MIIESQKLKVKSQNCNLKFKTDLRARSYSFALSIIKYVDAIPRSVSSDIITKQLIRAATSVGANIVEAKSASSRKDFINFYNHALKSANESKFWLELSRDSKKNLGSEIDTHIKEVTEIANMLASSIMTLKQRS